MKILHAAETIRGGVATMIRHNVEYQSGLWGGNDVMVLAPSDQIADLESAHPFRRFSFKRSGRDLPSFCRFVRAFVSAVMETRPDVVHLHSTFAGVLGRVSLLPLRLMGIRPLVVYCPHAWAFLMQGGETKKKIYATFEKLLLPLADRIICISRYEMEKGRRYGLTSPKIILIHNGIPQADAPARSDHAKTLSILFVGRQDYQKGFDIVLKVMKRLEGQPFHLIAVGDTVHAKDRPESRPNITYKGWVSLAEVSDYLDAADVLLMPSRWEGFGLVAAEAAAHGCPAIVTDCCSLPEIVKDGETGRLAPSEDDATIATILEGTDLRAWREMGLRARAFVRASFPVGDMARRTVETYGADA